jgi:hypothetical protein
LRLASVSVCNHTAADQLDVDCFAWVGSVFRPSGTLMIPGFPLMWGHQGSRSKRSVWVVTVAAVRWCRRDGDGDETRKEIDKIIGRTSMSSGTTSENPIYIPRWPRGMDEP